MCVCLCVYECVCVFVCMCVCVCVCVCVHVMYLLKNLGCKLARTALRLKEHTCSFINDLCHGRNTLLLRHPS